MIDVLYYLDDITVMYSMYPLLKGRYAGEFRFHLDPEKVLRSPGKSVLLFRMYKRIREGFDAEGFVDALKQKGKRVAYFDDTADPREIEPTMLSACDLYYKKQMLADPSAYERQVYGARLFTEYYHEKYGITDDNPKWALTAPAGDVKKIRLSWNLGIGAYPKDRLKKGLSMRLASLGALRPLRYLIGSPTAYRHDPRKTPQASGRFGTKFDRNTVTRHRTLFIEEMKKRPDLFFSGKVPLEQYNREMRTAAATVSPFGWGEICFRDFEAIINRSVLLKPSMAHIVTWPEVYRPDETYVPLDWDGADIIAKTEMIMSDERKRGELTGAAYAVYRDSFSKLDDKAGDLIEALTRGNA